MIWIPTLLLASLWASAAGANMDRHSITIYSKAQPGAISPATFEAQANNPDYRLNIPGYAMVRTVRPMQIVKGTSSLRFDAVAAAIDPTTVTFKSLTHPDHARVLEQNYRYDLVSTARMLDRFLGQELTFRKVMGNQVEEVRGQLMASNGADVVLALDDGRLISLGGGGHDIYFPNLPDGLITKPTLDWLIQSDRPGAHDIQVSYETKGMTWWADYNLLLEENHGCRLDVNAWVTIVNQSGGSFADARLKLIAGEVHRAPQRVARPTRQRYQLEATAAIADDGFQEQSFFEYHLYTLGRRASLPDRSIKQLELFPSAQGVKCNKQLVFDAGYRAWHGSGQPYTAPQNPFPTKGDVKVYLEFENRKDNGLGIALPAGRVRVSQLNPEDGNLEFIGEDLLEHTPRNESISVEMGNAFDVVGERKQSDFRWSKDEKWMEESIEVRIRNQKEQKATVLVRESLIRWTNWEIKNISHSFEKRDAASIDIPLGVDPEEEKLLRYTVRYEW